MMEESTQLDKVLNNVEQDDETLVCNSIGKDAHWAINKVLVEVLGLGRAAILTKLIDWHKFIHKKMDEKRKESTAEYYGGNAPELIKHKFFYISIEELSSEFGLGEVFCRQAIDMFANLGILEKRKAGLPARNFCKLDFKKICSILSCKNRSSLILVLNKFDESIKLARQNDRTCPMDLSKIIKTKENKIKRSKTNGPVSSSKEEEASRFARGSKSSQENKWRKEVNISTQTNKHLDKPNIQRLPDNNNGAVVLEKKSVTRGKRISCSNDTDSFEIINKWNDLGLMYVDPQHNKSIASRLDQLMSGRFFLDNPLSNGFASKYSSRAFTKDEILSAIENRARAACDIEYAPSDIKAKEKIRKVPFFVWLYEKNKGQSLFLKDFTKMAQLARAKSKLPSDEFPDYTEAIKEKYIQDVCGGIVLRRQWPLKDQENFINSATYLVECFNSISSRIGPYFSGGLNDHVDYLFKAIRFHMKESDNDKYFPTSWLCSEQTFMKFLPAYLKAQGILQPQYYDPTGMLNRQMRGFHRTEEE